jgi:amylosucrase
VFLRSNPDEPGEQVLVVANFDDQPQALELSELGNRGRFGHGALRDLFSGGRPEQRGDTIVVPAFGFYWLSDR